MLEKKKQKHNISVGNINLIVITRRILLKNLVNLISALWMHRN